MGRVIAYVLAAVGGVFAGGSAGASPLQDCLAMTRSGDSAAAIRCLEPLAAAGNAKAEGALGVVYATVNLPAHDAHKAAYWMRRAAEHGDIEAQVSAGYFYRQGEGVPTDPAESMRWFRTAAERGDQNAQVELARMYAKGWGTPKDAPQAIRWLIKAADQRGGHTTVAELSLAHIYLRGEGVPEDDVEAARWLRRAAEHGSPTAYLDLAQLDEIGINSSPDLYEAYVGYSIALAWFQRTSPSSAQVDAVKKRLDGVAAKLTVPERAKADRFVFQHEGEVH